MNTWQVVSSNGVLQVNMKGDVISVEMWPEGYIGLQKIQKFDMKEYEEYCGGQIQPGDSIDILLLGYWYNEYHDEIGENELLYEPPAEDYREETRDKIVMG